MSVYDSAPRRLYLVMVDYGGGWEIVKRVRGYAMYKWPEDAQRKQAQLLPAKTKIIRYEMNSFSEEDDLDDEI